LVGGRGRQHWQEEKEEKNCSLARIRNVANCILVAKKDEWGKSQSIRVTNLANKVSARELLTHISQRHSLEMRLILRRNSM